jgi:hypothetical protein
MPLSLRPATAASDTEFTTTDQMVVSVLLTDYGDHTFSDVALSSANSQTCGPDQMEIIILVEKDAGLLTRLLPTMKFPCKVVPTGPVPIGQAYALGIAIASGDVFCFLDNDDIWDSTRIETVIQVLSQNRNACLFKNAVSPIFEDGWHGARSKKWYDFSMGTRRVPPEQDSPIVIRTPSELRRVSRLAPLHNMSSIAVRKDFLFRRLDAVRQIQYFVDISIVLTSMASGRPLVYSTVPLTRYRVRGHSLSSTGLIGGRGIPSADSWKVYAAYHSTFKRLKQQSEGVESEGLSDVTEMLQFATGTFLFLRAGLPHPRELSGQAPRQLITSLRFGFVNFAWGALVIIVARVAPAPVRMLYFRFLHRAGFE